MEESKWTRSVYKGTKLFCHIYNRCANRQYTVHRKVWVSNISWCF